MRLIDFQYARALIQSISDKKQLDKMYTEAKEVIMSIFRLADFKLFLQNPSIIHDEKLLILKKIFRENINEVWSKFFALVLTRGRGNMLIQILESFLFQYEEINGIKKAKIITASPAKESTLIELASIANKMVQCEKLIIENVIDPSIIGGYIILVEDRQLDCSLKKHLHQVQQRLIA